MKKIFLGLAVLAFMGTGFTACKGKKKDGDKTEQTSDGKMEGNADGKMEGGADSKMDAGSSDGIAIPSFSDESVTKWCTDYKNMLEGIIAAYDSKDMAKVTDLTKNYTEWAQKSTEVAMKLATKPEEAQKFSDFITAVSNRYSEAMKVHMPQ